MANSSRERASTPLLSSSTSQPGLLPLGPGGEWIHLYRIIKRDTTCKCALEGRISEQQPEILKQEKNKSPPPAHTFLAAPFTCMTRHPFACCAHHHYQIGQVAEVGSFSSLKHCRNCFVVVLVRLELIWA